MENEQNQNTPFDWQAYGLPILGGVIVLVIIILGIAIVRRATTTSKNQITTVQTQEQPGETPSTKALELPVSSVTESNGENKQTEQAKTQEATTEQKTAKSTKELPKTGFPLLPTAGLFSLLGLAGFKLRKIA